QPVQGHDLVLDLELVLEALELGQPHVDRHLPALERRRDGLARLGALGAAAGGLALGALAATHAGLLGLGPWRRAQVMDLDRHLLDLLNGDEVADREDHAAELRAVLFHDDVIDPLQAERTQRVALVLLGPDLGADLRDLEPSHVSALLSFAASGLAGACASRSPTPLPRRGPPASRLVPRPRREAHGARRPTPATPASAGPPPWRGRC